ncbi:MAG: outer membrane protein assembly factor BamB family protein [Planctomycetota bacterium]|jgi:outer membrane protein assembly factor BamB
MRKTIILSCLIALLLSNISAAEDWPHWRGPGYNGSTDEQNLPATFSKTENMLWICPLPGESSATPIVSNGKVFVSSTDKDSKDLLALCIDAATGKELWRKKLGTAYTRVRRNNMATPSPVADGKHVYFLFGSGDLVCLDYDGEVRWSRNLQAEYGNITIKFGYSSSPLHFDGKLYVLIQRRPKEYRPPEAKKPLDSFMLIIDDKTGKTIRKLPRKTDAVDEAFDAYSSPLPVPSGKGYEIVTIGGDYVLAREPGTGHELWRYDTNPDKEDNWRQVSTFGIGDGLLCCVRPRGEGVVALRPGGKGTLSDDDVVWRFDGPAPDCSTPLYYRGMFFILAGDESKKLSCLDAKTGKLNWQGRLRGRGPYRASLTAADGKMYCIKEDGEVAVLSAGAEKFEVLSRVDLGGDPAYSSIAIAQGCLFIRTADNLYCVSNKK